MCEGIVNQDADCLTLRQLSTISKPLIVGLPMPFGIYNNEIAILNADRVTEPVQRLGRTPEVTELPITFQIDRVKDDMIVV